MRQSADVQEKIHLLDGDTLGLRQEEERPGHGDQQPSPKEEPGTVAHGGENVR